MKENYLRPKVEFHFQPERHRIIFVPSKMTKRGTQQLFYSQKFINLHRTSFSLRDKKQHNLQQLIKQPGPAAA